MLYWSIFMFLCSAVVNQKLPNGLLTIVSLVIQFSIKGLFVVICYILHTCPTFLQRASCRRLLSYSTLSKRVNCCQMMVWCCVLAPFGKKCNGFALFCSMLIFYYTASKPPIYAASTLPLLYLLPKKTMLHLIPPVPNALHLKTATVLSQLTLLQCSVKTAPKYSCRSCAANAPLLKLHWNYVQAD